MELLGCDCENSPVSAESAGCSFSLILGVDHSCHSTLINRIFTRVPFGIHFLLFKFSKFPSVMNDHQELPNQQQCKANKNNASHHTSDNWNDVRTSGALWSLHDVHDGLVVPVHRVREVEPAVVHILLLTVGQGVHLAWLGQLVPIFHLGDVEM